MGFCDTLVARYILNVKTHRITDNLPNVTYIIAIKCILFIISADSLESLGRDLLSKDTPYES